MRLHALTPTELAFLTAPAAEPDGLAAHLTRKLAATLSARLRLPVSLALQPAAVAADAPRTPVWQIDDALATLWLTRRLGGQRVTGAASFVPRTLVDTLDVALAEGWLDGAGKGALPSTLAWQVSADPVRATLAVQLPSISADMARWARGAIRHG